MTFEDILARCLDALEQGETIEHCVARYPQHAAELSSLLNLAVAVRSTPQPRLSASGFARGQAAVVAQARLQQAQHTPFNPALRAATQKLPPRLAKAQPRVGPKLIAHPARLAKPFLFVHKAQSAFIACLVVLSLFTLLRNVNISLPGESLYPVKILAENMEGVLLTAAGEQATWYAYQTENRLQELMQVERRDKIASAELEQIIDQQVRATLTASNHLPVERRNQFLLAWLNRLRALDQNKQWPNRVAHTLDRTLATIQTATQLTVVLPTPSPEQLHTSAVTSAASQRNVPPATPNPTTVGSGSAERVMPTTTEATVPVLTPAIPNPPIVSPDLGPAEPTELATATMASIIVQVPQETPTGDDHQSGQASKAAVAQPEQATASVSAAANPPLSDGGSENGQVEVQPSISVTPSLESESEKAGSPDHPSKADAPNATFTPSFGVVDAPTPATGNGPAIAPATAVLIEETAPATPEQTGISSTSTPAAEQTNSPTRMATGAATSAAMPSSTASTLTTPVPVKTTTVEAEKTLEPTATPEPTDTPKPTATAKPTKAEPTNTPDEATEEQQPTLTPASTPTPKKRR